MQTNTQFDHTRLHSLSRIFRKYWIVLVILAMVVSLFIVALNKYSQSQEEIVDRSSEVIVNKDDASNILKCTRSSRLDNDPKYDRALSLIEEKVSQGESHRSVWTSYNYFPAQLVNCIKIVSNNTRAGEEAEGYFDPNSKDIKPDYFPIFVDYVGYEWTDDLVTALLLVHEITHVQQYIMRPSCYTEGEFKLGGLVISCGSGRSCLNDEVAAFHSQLLFMSQLNNEEKKSIYSRIENDSDLHPQLKILENVRESLDIYDINECDIYDNTCIVRVINRELYVLLEESGTYDEQCGL